MKNQDTNSINFLSIIKADAWVSIFHSISRLITLAEEVEGMVLGIPSSEKSKLKMTTLRLDEPLP